MTSMPHVHRPTREDLLNAASGFWERLRIRWRWMAKKSFRKFNADDISAFVTWFVMSQTIWILVGTTTFFSAVFWLANSLRLQHYIAKALSDYLTRGTDIMIVFESAIVPKWQDSTLCFKNVYISRGPHTTQQEKARQDKEGGPTHPPPMAGKVPEQLLEDYNYTMFDLNVDSVDVTLSLWRWLDGKGLVKDAAVRGVRGIIDRRTVHWDPENPLSPADFRRESHPGDFELESLQLEDVLITVYQPDSFRPYTASIFRADFPVFRKRWLFYDFLCADSIVGQFDNCLFSLHKPQSIGRTTETDARDSDWARMSRLRIDGVNIDHLQRSTTSDGPLSWITSGKVDAVLDIKFPHDPEDELPFQIILSELADAISEHIPGQRELAKPPLSAPEQDVTHDESGEPRVIVDIDLRFRDLKASVPIFTNDISMTNNALSRPIVAFMNANRTLVPIRCRVVKSLNDFDGAWTHAGLMDDISDKIYHALAYHVGQANMNKRIKTVGLWSVQMTANAVLSALRRAIDPISTHLRETYTMPHAAMYEALLLMPQM
ncbi:mitochondrial distribution and morphology protein family 31/32 [Schizophyllum amplum]|uniref:Mitochondrial distribution and morphology protein family 31/32 n=1 Tax=Schizophyllum amplum TaxID=97359 RepID=A0A550CYY5_9AGAR|nr:mitochondrial distribution and morphology protein family 31/32 [Auriculariopsis ampla]